MYKRQFVKRVVGLPGETIEIADGVVLIDGEPLSEPYLDPAHCRFRRSMPPRTLGADDYFVMGDNRNGSSDSRDYRLGTVDTRYVIGKAAFLIFPGPDYETEKRDFKRIGVIWS